MNDRSTITPSLNGNTTSCLTLKTGRPDCLVNFYPSRFQLELAGGEQRIDLGYSGSRLLERLLQNPGEVVTREQLLQFAWADRVVGQGSLNQQVYMLRQILGDEKDRQIIQTLPRRGYLLNAQYLLSCKPVTIPETATANATDCSAEDTDRGVDALTSGATEPATSDSTARTWRWPTRFVAVLSLSLVAISTAAFYLLQPREAELSGKVTLGQLQLTYLGSDAPHRQTLQQQGWHLAKRLSRLATEPTELFMTMSQETLALLCLQTGHSARWITIPLGEIDSVADEQLRQCLP